MCIWPCRAAHHFSLSCCLKRNPSCVFASYQKPGSHVELWRDGLVMSPSCQGEVQPVQRLSLSWGISGVLPALQSEVQTDCCSFIHYLRPCFLPRLCSQPVESPRSTCPGQCSVLWRGSGGAVPWPSLKCAFRACQGLLSAAVACRTIS